MQNILIALVDEIITMGERMGLDQKEIATRAGVGETTISKIKAGRDVRVSTLNKLAQVVGLKPCLGTNKPMLSQILSRDLMGQSDVPQH